MEIWKDIIGYEWLYQVSSLWRVKSLKSWPYHNLWILILKPLKDSRWYLFQILPNTKKEKRHLRINRLVAQAFLWLDINDSKMFVCHKDDNPLNNSVDNLFLWTHQDNTNDRVKKWRNANTKWENNPKAKLKNCDVIIIKKMLLNKIPFKIIQFQFWISKWIISKINTGRTWKHI